MIEKVFVDSNVLVYAHNADSGDKQRIAANAIADILDARSGVLSIQVSAGVRESLSPDLVT
jgi:predicted nucleic acid-binding protein